MLKEVKFESAEARDKKMGQFQKIYPHLMFMPNKDIDEDTGVTTWFFDAEMPKTKDNPFRIFKAYDGYLIAPSELTGDF